MLSRLRLLSRISTRYILSVLILSSYSFSQKSKNYELVSINFVGNNTFSSSTLSSVILSKETPWWGSKFLNSFTPMGAPPVYFDSTKIKTDVSALNSFYEANGFFWNKVSAEYFLDSTDATARLVFMIEENDAFVYNSTSFFGLNNVPSYLLESLKSEFDIDYKKRYSESEVASRIVAMISTLRDNGYMYADFDSTIILIDSVRRSTYLNIYINTGSRIKIGEIVVEKNGSGRDEVSNNLLKDLTDFESGEYYSSSKITMSQQRLYRTELFNSVHVEAASKTSHGDLVSLLVKADVGDMNELSPEVIANDRLGELNLGLGLAYKRKNFLGDARRLGISINGLILDVLNFNFKNLLNERLAQDTTFQGEISAAIKIEQPYFLGKPLFASLESYYESVTIKKNTVSSIGLKTKLDFEMKPYTFINALSPYFSFEYLEALPNLDALGLKLQVYSYTSALGVELGTFKTDDLQYPTTGYNLSMNVEGATSLTEIVLAGSPLTNELSIHERAWFYVIQTTFSSYLAISNDRTVISGFKFKTGYIQTIDGLYELIPSNRTFFSGGGSSIRGWRSRELLPKDTIQYFGLTKSDILRGGTFIFEGSFELRNRFIEDFGVILFADYGNTWNGYKSFNFSDVAIAAGIGFRYYSPIVPFRIDFGLKFYDPSTKRLIWNNWNSKFWPNFEIHFGIGEAF